MSRIVQAYFENENQAQSAKIKVEAYGAKLLDIGPIESPPSKKVALLAPFAAGTAGMDGTAATGVVGYGEPAVVAVPTFDADARPVRKSGELRHALSLRVDEEDVDSVVQALRCNHGHVEQIVTQSGSLRYR